VIEALLAQARFWLDRGVDGFRVDAIDFGVHDPQLRNNPPRRVRAVGGSAPGSPFTMQDQVWNKARPELIELFLKPLHALTERYDGKVVLGEISGDDALLRAAEYTNGGGLDIAYSFDLLSCPGTPWEIRATIERLEKTIGDGWGCWSFSNHDVRRVTSRWGGEDPPEGLRRLVPVLLGSLRGTVCLYQGEELGLEEAELDYEQLKDPFGLAFWPSFKGRDGCRTPMPWQADAAEAGFTTGAPWLPIPDGHRRRAVDRQHPDEHSVLNTTRAFLNWRRERQPLRTGAIRFLRTAGDLLAFERSNNDRLLCLFNLGGKPLRWRASGPLLDAGFTSDGAKVDGRSAQLPPWGFAFAHLD
jgi:alpha-glucosidase